ncbi:hypothetical protein Tco_0823575 [Tanacetum coccineum]|uniref:Retrovirus-related Pol polyprotein from transposon TNT 1-94-like beta-barrel domain-containing protein n=1 Tax=Tanacetum coccineum TaxID=301880 RepID=A0ABQ5AI94_9ASTR
MSAQTPYVVASPSDDEASYHEDASENGTATNKPKQQQQQQQLIPTTTTISNIKLLILKKEENSKKRISTRKDGVVRILLPVSAAEIHAVEKERKARTILLVAIPKEHLRRFYGMDDAKEIWEAIRTRFGGNANSKKMQKAVLKQQFEAFTISISEGLEKGYDRFQQLLSQLEAHGVEVSTEDANHKFLRSLPPAWSNLAMTMRTKPDVDTLSIDDFKSSNNKVMSGHAEDLDLLHEDLEQIHDVDIEEMDINWQIAMIAIRMKKFYKKIGRRVRIDGNKHGINDGKKRDSFYQDQGAGKKEQNQNCLLTMDDGVVNWGEHTVKEEETNHALMAISSNNELTFQANEIYTKDEKLKKYRRIGMKVVKEKEQLQKIVDSQKDSSKNLWKLVNSGMNLNSKVGLGYGIKSNNEVLSYEEEMNRTMFNCTEEDFVEKPLYNIFSKTDNLKGVSHPLTGDYTPKPQQEIDESLYVYGKKGPQKHNTSVSDDKINEYSICQSNDIAGSFGNTSEHSVEFESEIISVPKEVSESNLSHLIRDCDFYEKKMAREAELKKQRVFNIGNGVTKPVWNNANRVNHANHFVPRPVQLNTVRPHVNTVRQNVNSVRSNVNTVRQNVNSVRSNVNTVRPKQPVTQTALLLNTAKMPYSHVVKGNWGTAVKTSTGYNWRNTRPNSNYNSRSNFVRTDHPLKNMEDRGIIDSGCSTHMTGNRDHLDDFEECKGGSVTFGGSKGYITGKGRIRVGYTWIARRIRAWIKVELKLCKS